jgi:hypothetical protein
MASLADVEKAVGWPQVLAWSLRRSSPRRAFSVFLTVR